eukprot:TRINITY_DN13533_c0_g1_i1.p1 TRINITY_DN13533_c0_g1~~TRINITY_DN13533_c0_g1_i1.p1  ORF type:complete len:198 (-),score=55.61 TRINITY_DN13533_c0_g1_i1:4-564(-)
MTTPAATEVTVPERTKINLCDPGAIKRVLDDAITKYFMEELCLGEETSLSNIKLILGFISVSLALTAQFYPAPFPENYYVLLICCPIYFVLSGILQYIATYKEKEYILFTMPTGPGKKGIKVRASLPKYSYDFTVGITPIDGNESQETKMTKSIGVWFDEEGKFYNEIFSQDLSKLFEEYDNKKSS